MGEQGESGVRWQLRTVPEERAGRYRDEGWWSDQTLGEMVDAGLGRMGDVSFRVHSAVHPWRGTFADVDRSARALAGALAAEGVGAGDVVVFQLPNWVEAGITFWAAAYLGAVVVPVVHFYGPKEVDYILRTVSPAVVVTADRFGHIDYLANYERLLADRSDVRWLVVGGPPTGAFPPGAVPFESLLGADPLSGPRPVDPDAPAIIGFTSG
ncbi:MAG: AMP-binding protein, partial [Acidimicrobiales bacterium]